MSANLTNAEANIQAAAALRQLNTPALGRQASRQITAPKDAKGARRGSKSN